MNTTKLFNKVDATGKVNGVAREVFKILTGNPNLTAGEIYLRYREENPKTERSRNEIAKRVSDLRNVGLIKANGKALCPVSSKLVMTWAPTGKTDVTEKVMVRNGDVGTTKKMTVVTNSMQPTSDPIGDVEARAVVLGLIARARMILAFRRVLPRSFVLRTEKTIMALQYVSAKGL